MDDPKTNPLCCLRAVDELRRQMGIKIADKEGSFAFLPIESLDEKTLAELRALPGARLSAIITGPRAQSLGIASCKSPMLFNAADLSFAQLRALADPMAGKTALPSPSVTPVRKAFAHTIDLAKHAALLPAVLVIEGAADNAYFSDWMGTTAENLARYIETPDMEVIETARANLPIDGAENATLVSYRIKHSPSVHLALIIGKLGEAPLTRIHSSCVTGDILGSLRCDCGPQLQGALSAIIAEGSGLLIYLHQEGRGIGITNKLRAYGLQEQGIDTYEANLMLGFEEDERDFSIADVILKKLGVKKLRLLTNNPEKIHSVENHGIKVVERVPLIKGGNRHNHAYIDAKIKKSGHLF